MRTALLAVVCLLSVATAQAGTRDNAIADRAAAITEKLAALNKLDTAKSYCINGESSLMSIYMMFDFISPGPIKDALVERSDDLLAEHGYWQNQIVYPADYSYAQGEDDIMWGDFYFSDGDIALTVPDTVAADAAFNAARASYSLANTTFGAYVKADANSAIAAYSGTTGISIRISDLYTDTLAEM